MVNKTRDQFIERSGNIVVGGQLAGAQVTSQESPVKSVICTCADVVIVWY